MDDHLKRTELACKLIRELSLRGKIEFQGQTLVMSDADEDPIISIPFDSNNTAHVKATENVREIIVYGIVAMCKHYGLDCHVDMIKGENIANILREIVANREQDRAKKPTLN